MKVSDNGGIVYFDGIIYRADKVMLKAQHEDGECTFGGFFEVEDDGEIITPKDVSRTLEALERESCEDVISRDEVLDLCDSKDPEYRVMHLKEDVECLPSVQPKPKTGHWLDVMVGDMQAQACDQCKTFYPLEYTGGGHKYCPNCGAKMVKSEE